MEDRYCIIFEIGSNYSQWIRIFKGNFVNSKIKIASFIINTEFTINGTVISKEVDSNTLNKIKEVTRFTGNIIAQDGYSVYYNLKEISREIVAKVTSLLAYYESEDYYMNSIALIGNAGNAVLFTSTLHKVLSDIESMAISVSEKEKLFEQVSKQTKIFKEKQLLMAKKDNEPKLIYFESSLPSESKGCYVKAEYITPNGTTFKHEGWEYT